MEYCLAVKPLTVTQAPPPRHQKNNQTERREIQFKMSCFVYHARLLRWKKAIRAQTGRAEAGYYYSVKRWLYLIHILEDCPFVACWKAIKGADNKNDCLASTPLFPSLFSSETSFIFLKYMWLLQGVLIPLIFFSVLSVQVIPAARHFPDELAKAAGAFSHTHQSTILSFG